jgi:iron complex outermembrane receptor protein
LNDIDFLPRDYFNRFEYESDRKVSQEFRITSSPQGRLSYVGGAYFLKDVWRLNQVVAGSANWVSPGTYSGQYSQRVSSKSVCAQAEFAFTERFKCTGGVRYTHEDKDAVLSRNTVTPGPLVNGQSGPFPETRLSRRESNLDGSVGLQYQLFSRGIVYASWSQGS